jgi:four helix bundle protein
MFLQLKHKELRDYHTARQLLTEVDRFAKSPPIEERWIMSSQIKRAALSVQLTIAE